MALRIRQWAYFAIYSGAMTAAEMTAFIGLEPDDVSIRGSRRAIPGKRPSPYRHKWAICVSPTVPQQTLDEQIEELIQRLTPHQSELRQVIARIDATEPGGEAGGVLQLVRELNTKDGELDGFQHRLLGWHLSASVVGFLASIGADIDVDEYGLDLPWWRFAAQRRYARLE